MNLLIKTSELEQEGPVTRPGLRQPPIRAYIDDVTIIITSTIGATWVSKDREKFGTWARISFNASNSGPSFLKRVLHKSVH